MTSTRFEALVCLTVVLAGVRVAEADVKKLLDATMIEATDKFYRWSEGSTIALDDQGRLLMGVTMFGPGGHDHTSGAIYEFRSNDGGLTWTPLEQAKITMANVIFVGDRAVITYSK